MNYEYQPKRWMHSVLFAAGLYNLMWGSIAILMPQTMLGWFGVDAAPLASLFWRCIGMMVGAYGVGFLIASRRPYHHWPIVLVGLIGKVLGPIGFIGVVAGGTLPLSVGWTILTNDLIWWVPFAMILWGSVRYHRTLESAYDMPEADDPIREIFTNTGHRLDDLANRRPQMVVFLRHSGCTFCREAMADIAEQRDEIEAAGCGIVLVHLGDNDEEEFFEKYGLQDLPRISDPSSRLYRQFGLDLGGFSELFGLTVWLRGIIAGLVNGHGIGRAHGNSFQMPGIYVYHCGQIYGGFRHEHASDRPHYVELAKQFVPPAPVAEAG